MKNTSIIYGLGKFWQNRTARRNGQLKEKIIKALNKIQMQYKYNFRTEETTTEKKQQV